MPPKLNLAAYNEDGDEIACWFETEVNQDTTPRWITEDDGVLRVCFEEVEFYGELEVSGNMIMNVLQYLEFAMDNWGSDLRGVIITLPVQERVMMMPALQFLKLVNFVGEVQRTHAIDAMELGLLIDMPHVGDVLEEE